MNLQSALNVMNGDHNAEFFNMRFVGGKLEIIALETEVFCGEASVNAIFESLNPFAEEFINEIEDDVLPVLDCESKLADFYFINKDQVPYFGLGYEAEHILWTVFPDLPDPDDLLSKDDEANFIRQAEARIEALFKPE
jgi:hypothetical protein